MKERFGLEAPIEVTVAVGADHAHIQRHHSLQTVRLKRPHPGVANAVGWLTHVGLPVACVAGKVLH